MLHKSSVRTQWNGLRALLVRNPCISLEIVPVNAIASSPSIYATTPCPCTFSLKIRQLLWNLT
ncbi:MAG: hypothetical protein VB140_04780 [Burkholderia sp.]